jgi:hypothetical protein
LGGRAAARAARATGQGTFFSKIQATGERLATTTTGEAPSARASVQAGHAPHESHFLQHTTGASRRRDYITDHAPRSTCLQGHTHCNFISDRTTILASRCGQPEPKAGCGRPKGRVRSARRRLRAQTVNLVGRSYQAVGVPHAVGRPDQDAVIRESGRQRSPCNSSQFQRKAER